MKRLHTALLLTLLVALPSSAGAAAAITPNEVYGETHRVLGEVTELRRHFGVQSPGEVRRIRLAFEPRHVWQKTYEILIKINILRAKLGFPVIAVNALEPVMDIEPVLVFEQVRRIRLELSLLKARLDIAGETAPAEAFTGKKPADVYHLLSTVSLHLDALNGTGFTPSHVYAQVMRIYADVTTLLDALEIKDATAPPAKRQTAVPADVFALGMELLKEIGHIQRASGIHRLDFSDLWGDRITPTEVFAAMELILAELQTLKAGLGLRHAMTPPAAHYEGKNPADVHQVLGWTLRKLKLVRSM